MTLPLKLTVPVPLRLNAVVKTSPLKLTVVAFAPAVISINLIKFVPVKPVIVELPVKRMLATLLILLVMPPPTSLSVLMLMFGLTVSNPAPVVSTPVAWPTLSPGATPKM